MAETLDIVNIRLSLFFYLSIHSHMVSLNDSNIINSIILTEMSHISLTINKSQF